jgi:HK97 family phage major capsid protein
MTDLNQTVEKALSAFEAFKSELQPKLGKLDALDTEKFNKLEKAIGDAIELQQKEAGERKALQDTVKALEASITRPASAKEDGKEKEAKTSQVFGDFLRKGSASAAEHGFIGYAQDKGIELKDLSVGIDANGGFLVMPAFGGVVQTKVFESSPLRQLATVQPISTDSYEVVVDYDETGASWVGETATRSATTTPAIGKINIPTHELSILVEATQKILDDGAVNVEAWLAGKVADKAARAEATAFVSGDGVAKPRGILSYTAGTTITSSQIEQINAGSTSAFTYAGLANLQNALKEPYQANASFLMKRASFGNIMQIVTGISGDNRPIFNMMYDKNTGLATAILGKPVYFADDMETIASASLSAAYGDFRSAYTIVDRIGLRTLRDPYSNKPFVQFYTTKRVGGAVVNFEAIKIQKMSS